LFFYFFSNKFKENHKEGVMRNFKQNIITIFLILNLLLLSSCFMVARKGVGQLRSTESNIENCSSTIVLESRNYDITISAPKDSKLTDEKQSYFYLELEKNFKKHKVTIHHFESNRDTLYPHLTIQFDNIEHSFIKNAWELEGKYILENKGEESKSNFTLSNHKSIEAVEDLLSELAEEMVTCLTQKTST